MSAARTVIRGRNATRKPRSRDEKTTDFALFQAVRVRRDGAVATTCRRGDIVTE